LFYRFKPVRYYFIMVLLGKHLILGLVPAVLPDQSRLQALAISLVLAGYSFTQSVLWPWRSNILNVADALACLILLVIVVCGSLGMNDTDGSSLIQMVDGALAAFLFGMLCVACALGLHERLTRQKYQFFICHHKAEAAAQARYLKLVLQQLKGVSVFIDSDDLRDLDALFDTIKTSVQQLVLYLTAGTLRRPWCVGEVVTSMKAKIRILPVHTKTFSDLTLGYIEEIVLDVVDGSELMNFEIGLQDAREALRNLIALPVVQLRAEKGSSRFYRLGHDILRGSTKNSMTLGQSCLSNPHMNKASSAGGVRTTASLTKPTSSVERGTRWLPSSSSSYGGQVLVSTLPGNDEALATGGIIKLVIGERIFRAHNAIVSLLEDDVGYVDRVGDMACTALAIVTVLTPGTLQSAEQIRVISVASSFINSGVAETCLIPVTTPGFEFPHSDYYRYALSHVYPDGILCDAEDVVKSFFRLISIFLPTHESQQVLETSCVAIMERLEAHNKAVLQNRRRGPSESYGSRGSRARKAGTRFARGMSPGGEVTVTPTSQRSWGLSNCSGSPTTGLPSQVERIKAVSSSGARGLSSCSSPTDTSTVQDLLVREPIVQAASSYSAHSPSPDRQEGIASLNWAFAADESDDWVTVHS